MQYEIRFKPRALKDGRKIPTQELVHIFEKIKALEEDLSGDVKVSSQNIGAMPPPALFIQSD